MSTTNLGYGETTQVNTRISATMSPAASPLPSKFQKLGRGLIQNAQRASSLPPPPPRQVPRPARASDARLGPALAHHYSKAPSPRPRNSNAARPPPAPGRPCGGRREAGRGPGTPHPFLKVGEGGTLREAAQSGTIPRSSGAPAAALRFKWGGVRGVPLPTHPNPVLRSFPGQGRGWLRALDRP